MTNLVDISPMVPENLMLSMHFAMALLSLLEKELVLNLNKFEFPFPKDAECQVWLVLANWFSRRFFNVI